MTDDGWLQTTTCPACGGPAEVVARHVQESTGGPVEHAHVRCVRRHTFNLPTAMLVAAGPVRPRAGRSATTPAAVRPNARGDE